MTGYRSLDLSRHCNVGAAFTAPGNFRPLLGKQVFHGLPFFIGATSPTRRKCLVGFNGTGGATRPVTILIKSRATYLIFAHALLESRIYRGGPVGETVAHYVFRFAIGTEVRAPIRERFEIGFPLVGGPLPFAAVPDMPDYLLPRMKGSWGDTGWRQCETMQGWAKFSFLWAWKNPEPRQAIQSVTIEPGSRPLFLAAITVSQVDEYPFCTTARRAVKITLPRKADAEKPFDLNVAVDRGVATYPYPLPAQDAKAFLRDDRKGWGEAPNPKSSPAYVEIAATPSATVTVSHGDKPLAKARWSELERKGRIRQPRAELKIVDPGRNWVHTTVVDDRTGKPIPCRVHFRSIDGIPYQPHGHHDHLLSDQNTWHIDIGGDCHLGQVTYAYTDGQCQGWLPRGKIIVDVARGFEYEPLRQIVEIKPGQRELELRLKRWTDMNARRWFSGDTHVHFLGERGAHFEAGAEDLNLINLMASQWGHLFTNAEDFIGRPTTSRDGKTIVYCSQENRQHMLGHLSLLGLKEPVMPWCSDGPAEAELAGNLETTLSRWADACHAQGGTVIIPHLPIPNGEPATLIATGRADAVEFIGQLNRGQYGHLEYYRYLNGGYKLPLVGGTDKMSSEVPVGLCRTYVRLPADEEFGYDNWCKHLRAGRTFMTSGPLLRFTVNGAEVGDEIQLPGNGGTLEVEAVAESIFPVHALQIVQAGNVVAATEETRGARTLRVRAQVKVDRHTWLAARCAGPNYEQRSHHDVWRRAMFAHTSPVYVAAGGSWDMFDPGTAQYMLTLIDGCMTHIRGHARRFANEKRVTHHHAEPNHEEFLLGPFKEAAAAIHKRMHERGINH